MMDHSPGSTARTGPPLADRIGLWVIGTGAALLAVLYAVGMALQARLLLGDEPVEVAQMPLGNASSPAFTEPFAAVTSARYETATVTVEGAPSAARWLLWGADAASSLAALGICVTLVWLCLRVARRRPFGRSITAALLVTASLVMVGGMVEQVLGAVGRAEIVTHLGPGSTAGDHGEGIVEGFAGFHLDLSLAPVGVALAIGVVAAAFEIGARLQRDTEGLV